MIVQHHYWEYFLGMSVVGNLESLAVEATEESY